MQQDMFPPVLLLQQFEVHNFQHAPFCVSYQVLFPPVLDMQHCKHHCFWQVPFCVMLQDPFPPVLLLQQCKVHHFRHAPFCVKYQSPISAHLTYAAVGTSPLPSSFILCDAASSISIIACLVRLQPLFLPSAGSSVRYNLFVTVYVSLEYAATLRLEVAALLH